MAQIWILDFQMAQSRFFRIKIVDVCCDSQDGPDLASNLLCNGWSGILVEGALESSGEDQGTFPEVVPFFWGGSLCFPLAGILIPAKGKWSKRIGSLHFI